LKKPSQFRVLIQTGFEGLKLLHLYVPILIKTPAIQLYRRTLNHPADLTGRILSTGVKVKVLRAREQGFTPKTQILFRPGAGIRSRMQTLVP